MERNGQNGIMKWNGMEATGNGGTEGVAVASWRRAGSAAPGGGVQTCRHEGRVCRALPSCTCLVLDVADGKPHQFDHRGVVGEMPTILMILRIP